MTHLLLESALAQAWPPEDWCEVTVLLAVSGGADSVAMLRALHKLKRGGEGRLAIAHFNHGIRGQQADRDEAFVQELSHRLGVAFHAGRPEQGTLPTGPGQDGLEASARRARYTFLQRTAARLGARFVVTAHTADDQAETILHRIVRGTGIAGLSGMARARALGEATTLLRPMLGLRRADVLAYLDELGQPYRHDHTNQDTQFTRNRIRHELLPLLAEQFNPGVVDAVLRLGTLASEVQAVVRPLVERLRHEATVPTAPGTLRIRATPLGERPRFLVRQMLLELWREQGWPMQSMGLAEWDALAEMAEDARPSKRTFPGNIEAEVQDDELVLKQTAPN
jgi:tRNA(Ile)-lysidine synthase